MLWMNQEERLFRRLERHIVEKRLRDGFLNDEATDVDGFIKFSLSIQNRRKSRAGYALENHIEEIFIQNKILYNREARTENKSKPDFIFPHIDNYLDFDYPAKYLNMLAAKTTCKDRWRQILTEADRIPEKHLLTLEPGISENQTNEMIVQNVKLIVPSSLKESYTERQRSWLMNLNEFISILSRKQTIKIP
ncbi:MAG TPA: hypothetical protein ENH91_12080 [Leeuwenhoekiella sp.]|nr:hypothetical protein [Leeuwenhoekiella sp.]